MKIHTHAHTHTRFCKAARSLPHVCKEISRQKEIHYTHYTHRECPGKSGCGCWANARCSRELSLTGHPSSLILRFLFDSLLFDSRRARVRDTAARGSNHISSARTNRSWISNNSSIGQSIGNSRYHYRVESLGGKYPVLSITIRYEYNQCSLRYILVQCAEPWYTDRRSFAGEISVLAVAILILQLWWEFSVQIYGVIASELALRRELVWCSVTL